MLAEDVDQTTYDQFKTKILTDVAASIVTKQAAIAAAIAEAATSVSTNTEIGALFNSQTYRELLAYSETMVGYKPVNDPEEDAFNIAKAKAYAELLAASTLALAAQKEEALLGNAQYYTYSLMLDQLGDMTLAELIAFAELQQGYSLADKPNADKFADTKNVILATIQSRQTLDLDASQIKAETLLTKGNAYGTLATDIDVMSYIDFQAWVATL